MATVEELQREISRLQSRLGNLKRVRAAISGCTQIPFKVYVEVNGIQYSTDIPETDRNYLNVMRAAYDKVREGFTEGLQVDISEVRSQLSTQYLLLAAAFESTKAELIHKSSDILVED
ncbi:hypothetical protein P13BB106kb_p062 [Pectobacterium phage DU_PP_V]|uniref:Uncharacterized protein n=1 Tax=Pectobacterium phage DU_PP_V TaxID=2041492 RepID=A0A2D2W6X0_9CAUD|nr:hypothetical protein HOS40_gp107 [Pectobacterium phage DU_PP_V]ATS94046.1 hypothetical protein P13BB106kb_p062 [Pectobacterium phage DU_PP_V]